MCLYYYFPYLKQTITILPARVSDPHWFNADPDPDPAFFLIADPDSGSGSKVWWSKIEKNIQHFKRWKFCPFSIFWVIFALLDPDPDPTAQINADPCGSGSETLLPAYDLGNSFRKSPLSLKPTSETRPFWRLPASHKGWTKKQTTSQWQVRLLYECFSKELKFSFVNYEVDL